MVACDFFFVGWRLGWSQLATRLARQRSHIDITTCKREKKENKGENDGWGRTMMDHQGGWWTMKDGEGWRKLRKEDEWLWMVMACELRCHQPSQLQCVLYPDSCCTRHVIRDFDTNIPWSCVECQMCSCTHRGGGKCLHLGRFAKLCKTLYRHRPLFPDTGCYAQTCCRLPKNMLNLDQLCSKMPEIMRRHGFQHGSLFTCACSRVPYQM